MKNVVLSNEDFQDFPIGEFPYDKDHTAMGEYQYVVENGYHGNWVDMVCTEAKTLANFCKVLSYTALI